MPPVANPTTAVTSNSSSTSSRRRREIIPERPPPLPPPPFLKSLSSSVEWEESKLGSNSSNATNRNILDERYTFQTASPHILTRRRSGPIAIPESADGHHDSSNTRSYQQNSLAYQHQPKIGSPRHEGKHERRQFTILFDLVVQFFNVQNVATTCAVLLWYLLGVLSISTTKVLLSGMNVKPLWLSVQQFVFGCLFLNLLLESRWISTSGKQPLPRLRQQKFNNATEHENNDPLTELILTAVFFGFGFVATNYSFQHGAASFVETVKASEPITSAIAAVAYGVDTVSINEGISLLGIVSGVLISTFGSYLVQSRASSSLYKSTSPSITSSFYSCFIVLLSNLCFSFRGVHQKLLRSTNSGSAHMMDDLNLQYRIQCISALIFFFPALIVDIPDMLRGIWERGVTEEGLVFNGPATQYVGLSLVNGFAFVSYNLASTYVLTRLAVVHHAALNCLRRIFAIAVTSLLFQVPLGSVGILGVLVSFISFLFYTHYKVQRQNKPRPVSSLLPMSAVLGSN